LAGDALDRCRRWIQQIIQGHRGRKDDPLYRARRTLHTGAGLLTDKQKDRLLALFAADEHVQVEATWTIYQQMIAAYREPDRTRGRALMVKLIESLSHGLHAGLRRPGGAFGQLDYPTAPFHVLPVLRQQAADAIDELSGT